MIAAVCFTAFMCLEVCKQLTRQLPATVATSVSSEREAYRVSFLQENSHWKFHLLKLAETTILLH